MKELTPKKANAICIIMLIAGALIGYLGVFLEILPLSVVGVIIMIGSIAFRIVFYRCPHCGRYLDRSSGGYCPYCGKNVNN
jgi:4-diphosphocytidyl-2-C-methyl-D-erythritol kinase